jgi:hypothetical protein
VNVCWSWTAAVAGRVEVAEVTDASVEHKRARHRIMVGFFKGDLLVVSTTCGSRWVDDSS